MVEKLNIRQTAPSGESSHFAVSLLLVVHDSYNFLNVRFWSEADMTDWIDLPQV
jgi:hypothetical protein